MLKKVVAVIIGVLVGYWLIDDFKPDSINGKQVFITGASTGIGEQLAYQYAKLGANIVITARRENKLKEVIARCRELGTPNQIYDYVVADMLILNTTEEVLKAAVKKLGGGLDILVLNHIILLDLGLWTGSSQNLSLLDPVLKVNFQSYVYLASYALPHLERSHGSLVVVSSLAGKIGQPFVPVYSASKFALDGFFSGLRQEFVMRNCDVSITLCLLGLIGTENSINQLTNFGQEFLLNMIRPASVSDTAYAIIRGGALRVRQMYYPYMQVLPFVLLREWFPNVCEFLNRIVYS